MVVERERISNVNEFAEYVAEHLFDVEPELNLDHTVEVNSITKNNGLVYHGVIVRESGCNIAPTLYVDNAYSRFEEGTQMEELIDELFRAYEVHKISDDFSVDFFKDFMQAKENLTMKLINAERNAELLSSVPHYKFGDLAVIFQVRVNAVEFGTATITVRNEHKDMWGVSTTDLFLSAKLNMDQEPLKIQSIYEVLMGMVPVYEEDDFIEDMGMSPMYVLSNESKLNGAIGMLFTNKLHEFAEKAGCNLYILPSSIHECLLVPDKDIDPEMLASMIVEVNCTEVAPEDILSDTLYYFDKDSHQLMIAESGEVMELIEG